MGVGMLGSEESSNYRRRIVEKHTRFFDLPLKQDLSE